MLRLPIGHKYFAACTLLILLIGIDRSYAWVKEKSSREYKIKAAYLYNFAKFIEWPKSAFSNPESPFNICILGQDPFGEALGSIEKKTIRGRKLIINRHQNISVADKYHIIFISKSEKKRLKTILASLKGRAILTISDLDGFVEAGGIIGMVMKGNKIQFIINLQSGKESGLIISSQLLKLSLKVL